jgi:EAL and modified HD-GYP domain-containing signal transduction protein
VTLIGKLNSDVAVEEIIDVFSRHANLGVGLLRLVNSSAMGARVALGRIADAVNYLGRRQLARWVRLALYGSGSEGMLSPLLPTAARRGRLMEIVVNEAFEGAPQGEGERAFLVGMLSLLDVLLGQPLPDLIPELNLEEELVEGLLKRAGSVGMLLDLAEAIERLDMVRIHDGASAVGITVDRLQEMDLAAYGWVHDLNRETP